MAEAAKTALIFGASGTLGSAIACQLLSRGYALGLHYHTHREPCDGLTEGAATGWGIRLYQADFVDPAAPAAVVSSFLKDFQKIDALVWAAGIVRDAPLLTSKEDDLRAVLNIDLKAFFLILKAASRQFIKQKSGSVLALSSHAAIAGRAGGSAYAMAHSGLLALIKSVAREWGPLGVRVNAVLPPFVEESGMGRAASPDFVAAVKSRRVLKNSHDGITALGAFVAGVIENSVLSGQVLSVDSRI